VRRGNEASAGHASGPLPRRVPVRLRLGLGLLLALAGLLVPTGSALGAPDHVFSTTFSGSGGHQLGLPRDVAIDHSTGDVYVIDDDSFFDKTDGEGNNRVVKFDEDGNFILMFGRDVNKTTGADVCTATSGHVCGAGVAGSGPGAFLHAHFIAVDNSDGPSAGSVYVGEVGKTNFRIGQPSPIDPLALISQRAQKFSSNGVLQSDWGDAIPLPNGTLYGLEFGQSNGCQEAGFPSRGMGGVAVDNLGRFYMMCSSILRYSEDGKPQTQFSAGGGQFGLEVNSLLQNYSVNHEQTETSALHRPTGIWRSTPTTNTQITTYASGNPGSVALGLDASGNDFYAVIGENTLTGGDVIRHHGANCNNPCPTLDEFGLGQLDGAWGMDINPATDDAYVANTGNGNVAVFGGTVPGVTPDPASNVDQTSATLSGEVDPLGRGDITTCYFEYGLTQSYGQTAPCDPDPASSPPGSNFTTPTDVSADLIGLEERSTYHFRLVAGNAGGENKSKDQVFATTQPPVIKAVYASDLGEDTVTLNATINPSSLDTTYRFEYGETANYGLSAPVPDGTIQATGNDRTVSTVLTGLDGGLYHYRLVAENDLGTSTSQNKTFNFFPAQCPNSRVRQQTGAAYLPDCRAYELVSPGFGGGTILFPEGPLVPFGDYRSGRFAYVGAFGVLPDSGEPPNYLVDLYAATRTSTGWVTKYVGIPASVANISGGPGDAGFSAAANPHGIMTDLSMSRYVTWNYDEGARSYAPYVYDNNGVHQGRLPTTADDVPGSLDPLAFVGDGKPSPDFSTWVFSSRNLAFAEGGLTEAPGSVYVNEIASDTVTIVSKTPLGGDIQQDPAASSSSQYIRIPAISADGSHVLMSTQAPSGRVHLYMAVNDGGQWSHYDVSRRYDGVNRGVDLIDDATGEFDRVYGMTRDGSRVYFASPEQLTRDDSDTSEDVFMWSEATGEVTRVTRGGETQAVTVDATAGSYTLGFDGDSTGPLAFNASAETVEAALVALAGIGEGGVVVTGGPGGPGGEDPYLVSFTNGSDVGLLNVDDSALTGSVVIGNPGNEKQRLSISAAAGTYTLEYDEEPTAPIDFDEPAAGVQAILEAVPGIGGGNVTVAGGPSEPNTVAPYEITIDLDGATVSLLRPFTNSLTGGSQSISTNTLGSSASDTNGCSGGSCHAEIVPVPQDQPGPNELPKAADNAYDYRSGDLYFYSPERLIAGTDAVQNQKNLYLNRGGRVEYLFTLPAGNPPIRRIQVTPDNQLVAFITPNQLTPYDNQGTNQMYTLNPDTGEITCVSCNPNGNPPAGDADGSQNGRFVTDDGRTFFSIKDSLVPQDVNGKIDVYEFTGGRPQLITTGTGEVEGTFFAKAGLVSVSGDGVDVFFSSFEELVAQDHNGASQKIYTAHTNGGFLADPEPLPCLAAEECHGASSTAPAPQVHGTTADLGTRGNFAPAKARKRKRQCPKGKRLRRARGKGKARCVKRNRRSSRKRNVGGRNG
jgi:hypothetical protein